MKNQLITLSTRQDVYRKIDSFMGKNPQKKYDLTLVEVGKKRRISANNQQHLWYGQVANYYGDRSALEVKNFCKDAFGLPLVLNNEAHSDKMEFLLDKLNYFKHSHESKMKLIQCLEVTSLLTTAESKILMDQMIYYFNEQGIPIKFKD